MKYYIEWQSSSSKRWIINVHYTSRFIQNEMITVINPLNLLMTSELINEISAESLEMYPISAADPYLSHVE